MQKPRQDGDILRRLAKALGVDPDRKPTRDCRADGHSFDHSINDKIICSFCGRTKAEVEAATEAGSYEYEAIKYLDE